MATKKIERSNEDEIHSSTEGVCGIVMPISPMGTYSAEHWADVYSIIVDAAEQVGLSPKMVSQSNYIGIIQKRIINNLYHNEMVICDVSGKNPNVMFELGMRLAFDKPTVIIKDDATDYTFDTNSIEHLTYPRDLRYATIVKFKEDLANKIKSTRERFKIDSNASTFLKEFGEFEVANLPTRSVSQSDFAISELRSEFAAFRQDFARLKIAPAPQAFTPEEGKRIEFVDIYKDLATYFKGLGKEKLDSLTRSEARKHQTILATSAAIVGVNSADFKDAFDFYVNTRFPEKR